MVSGGGGGGGGDVCGGGGAKWKWRRDGENGMGRCDSRDSRDPRGVIALRVDLRVQNYELFLSFLSFSRPSLFFERLRVCVSDRGCASRGCLFHGGCRHNYLLRAARGAEGSVGRAAAGFLLDRSVVMRCAPVQHVRTCGYLQSLPCT